MTPTSRCGACSRAASGCGRRPAATSTRDAAPRTASTRPAWSRAWAVDRAAAILDRADLRNFAINAGGDIRARGRWRIGIQHPLQRQAVASVVEGEDLAVATSGAHARGDHVRDPHTGLASSGILSVTVTGPELATADAYATAAFAMDTHCALAWTALLHGYEALTILADCRVLATPGFPAVEDRGRPVDRPALDQAGRVDAVRGAASRVGRRLRRTS